MIPIEIIILIAEYEIYPYKFLSLSREIYSYMKQIGKESLNILVSKYKGISITADGNRYRSIYLSLTMAIKSKAPRTLIHKVCMWNAYLPMPWDLTSYDIIKHGGYKDIVSPRWSQIGHALYGEYPHKDIPHDLLQCIRIMKNQKEKYRCIPLLLGGFNDWLEKSDVERLNHILSDCISSTVEGIHPPDKGYTHWTIAYCLSLLYNSRGTLHRTDPLCKEKSQYLTPIVHEGIIYGKSCDSSGNILVPKKVSLFPFLPLILTLDTVILLDRPDLLAEACQREGIQMKDVRRMYPKRLQNENVIHIGRYIDLHLKI